MPNCSKCGALIVWLGTAGGKRMPIDARLKDLFEQKFVWAKEPKPGEIQETPKPLINPVKGYTSHLSTCPNRDIAATKP